MQIVIFLFCVISRSIKKAQTSGIVGWKIFEVFNLLIKRLTVNASVYHATKKKQ